MFIQGMGDANELTQFIQRKFPQKEIQAAYEIMLEETKALARAEGLPVLKAFWKLLGKNFADKVPPLKCGRGCAHCCYTGVSLTQMEWDGILQYVKENGIDLNEIIERSQKTIDKVKQTLKSVNNLEQVDWHRLVINQPCPFLNEDQSCGIYENRPLDCRLVVAFRDSCESKNLEHAQRGVVVEEAVASTVIARLQYEQTPKIKRRKFHGTQPLRLFQNWLIHWQEKSKKKRKKR